MVQWYVVYKKIRKCRRNLFFTKLEVQPRSQGLSSLPPLVVGRKTLVAAGHMTTCDTNFPTGVEPTNNFCRSQLQRKKGHRYYTFEIFQSCWKLHTGQTKYMYWSITLISIPAGLFTHAQWGAWVIKWAPFLRFGVTFVSANLCSHTFTTQFLGGRWVGDYLEYSPVAAKILLLCWENVKKDFKKGNVV